jgi:putative hemolysin
MLLILIILLILIAGFISASEGAIISFRIEENETSELKESTLSGIEYLQKNIDKLFAVIHMTTTLCLVTASFLSVLLIKEIISHKMIFLRIIFYLATIILISFFYWVVGFLIPKAVGSNYSKKLGPILAGTILTLTKVFNYPMELTLYVSNFILSPFKTKVSFLHSIVSEDEIRVLINEGLKTGSIDKTEHEYIENVFEFNDLKANEVMIPRTEMTAIKLINDDVQMFHDILKTGHNLIPIFQESLDNILGIVHIKDLLRQFIEKITIDIKSLIRPAYFVPEAKLISDILKEMQKRGERICIVTDEYGGTEGVITLEDILSEIVGDINYEGDKTSKDYSKLPDNHYIVLGIMSIEDFNNTFNYQLPESEEYTTIAGFISYQTGKILNAGDIFNYENLTFKLIKKIRQKMVQFKVYSKNEDFKEK